MASIYDWSTTSGSNASHAHGGTVGTINFAEGQAPSTLNDSSRAALAALAGWRDLLGGVKISSGTNTVTLTSGLTLTAYAQGQLFSFEAGGTNTGAVTLNVDSIGAKAVVKHSDVAVAAGDIKAAGIYLVAYEATNDRFQLLSTVANAPGTFLTDPMTTRGDIIVRNSSNATARLAAGSANTVLQSDGTDPSFGTVATAMIADNAVTLAKMAGGIDGNIISYDASGDPVAIATGSDGQVLTSAGAGAPPAFEAAGGGGLQSMQVFTSSGTWTKPAGIARVKVTVVGGGGGAGGAGSGASTNDAASGGGGAGAAIVIVDVSSISTVAVTVGAGGAGGTTYTTSAGGNSGNVGADGGTSSFGTHASGTPGTGGLSAGEGIVGGSNPAQRGARQPGAGGTGTGTGVISIAGGAGGRGINYTSGTEDDHGGEGGASFTGGTIAGASGTDVGADAVGYGAGGSAGRTGAIAGGDGQGGLVWVEEYQ